MRFKKAYFLDEGMYCEAAAEVAREAGKQFKFKDLLKVMAIFLRKIENSLPKYTTDFLTAIYKFNSKGISQAELKTKRRELILLNETFEKGSQEFLSAQFVLYAMYSEQDYFDTRTHDIDEIAGYFFDEALEFNEDLWVYIEEAIHEYYCDP